MTFLTSWHSAILRFQIVIDQSEFLVNMCVERVQEETGFYRSDGPYFSIQS